MEKKVNRNILWSELFFRHLHKLGVKNAVFCPGSRNTSLVFGCTQEKKITRYNLVDERSAGFFALGLAKITNSPVAIITTSGTAVAELYPAIIEAYFQRAPLIVCTADRPPELQNCGSNQTINQKNIFKNHIRYFVDLGTPGITINNFKQLFTLTKKALSIATIRDAGPVHLNFPFRKPFEPDSFTDELADNTVQFLSSKNIFPVISDVNKYSRLSPKTKEYIYSAAKGMIIFNEKNPSKKSLKLVTKLSDKLNFPIIEDGTSGIRFFKDDKNVINNSSAIYKSEFFRTELNPELILQFGEASVSNSLLDFFEKSRAKKYLINNFGEIKDPSRTFTKIFGASTEHFCQELLEGIKRQTQQNSFLNNFLKIDRFAEEIKTEFLKECKFNFEGKIINEVVKSIPDNNVLFISNSMPIRDFDVFASGENKNLSVYTNRGASGIDGINSTALGIASQSENTAVLITGDLAFYHDLNGLLAAYKYNIPLLVILINNNGGGIFEMLPVAKHKDVFEENFKVPMNLNFKNFVQGYNGIHKEIKSEVVLRKEIKTALESKRLTVLEIKSDSTESTLLRKKYYKLLSEKK